MKRGAYLMLAALFCLVSAPAFAQGRQSGALSGRVSSSDGVSLPGATVTIGSEALQGLRTAVTDVNGVYRFPELPPGEYTVTFEMNGMSSVRRHGAVPLGADVTMDQTLALAPVQEVVDVRGATPPPVSSPAGAFNVRAAEVNLLPMGRTPFFIAELAPGLTDNTPNGSQVTVAGAFAYDNVFLMDGVDINDNVLGQPNNLFIEDAIDQVQVLTSGISSEYGRFSGGVVNVVTKSGGNDFSGAFRLNLSNSAWSRETPFEEARGTVRASKLSPTYEATLGGPILRDRLWFFGGTRIERTTTQGAFAQTGTPFTSKNDNTRYEGKLTGTIRTGHTLQGTFIDNTTDLQQPALGASIDPASMTKPSTPNRLLAGTWRGAIGPRTFATAQYSQKWWKLENAGGTSKAILDSPFLSRGVLGVPGGLQYNAPYFDSTDPEQRNNRQFTASLSQLLSTRRAGTHEVKGGFEYFVSTRVGGNSQTSTGYVFQTDYKLDGSGRPALDAAGHLIPRFVPGTSRVQVWMPLRGATIDLATASLFANDHWTAGSRLTLDLGARFERVTSDATGGIQSVDATTLVPRLGASYDLTGDGRTVVQGTYAHYAGKYNDVQFSRDTNVGNPDRITSQYTGPAGEGRDFAAGFDPGNYTPIAGTFPTANIFFADDLKSPLTREFTVAFAREFNVRGWARATYVHRHATDFVEDFITIDGGKTTIARNGISGVFDNAVYRNTNIPKRDYQALELQSAYRFGTRATVNGHWTVQLKNNGTFEGEGTNNPAAPSLIGDYPEIYVAARSFPDGRLDDFQRSKVRLWGTYGVALGPLGRLDFAPMYRYNSAKTYSLVGTAPISAQQVARNPGYARLPTSQPVFFGARGAQSFAGYHLADLSATYGVPVWQSVRPWVKLEVLNLLNNQTLISWDTTITADNAGPKDANGLPINYVRGANFGKGTSNGNYPRPRGGMDGGRTFLLAAGIRF
jgi:hypothetical protein